METSLSKWDSMKLHESGLLLGDQTHCTLYRTPGSLPSNFLSKLLSLCKNTMTSANRRVNSSWPAEANTKNGRLPRHSIFIFISSIFSYNSIGPCFLSYPPESLSPHLKDFFPSIAPDHDDRNKAFSIVPIIVYYYNQFSSAYRNSIISTPGISTSKWNPPYASVSSCHIIFCVHGKLAIVLNGSLLNEKLTI